MATKRARRFDAPNGWAALAKLIERRVDEARAQERFCWKHGFPNSEKWWAGHAAGLLALAKEVPTLAYRVKVPPIAEVIDLRSARRAKSNPCI